MPLQRIESLRVATFTFPIMIFTRKVDSEDCGTLMQIAIASIATAISLPLCNLNEMRREKGKGGGIILLTLQAQGILFAFVAFNFRKEQRMRNR